MRTAKKSSKSKTKMSAGAKPAKAIAKAKPRALAKAKVTAKPRKPVKSKTKGAVKTKVRPMAKAALKKAAPKAKAAPKKAAPKAKAALKKAAPKAKAAPKKAVPKATLAAKVPPRRDATGHLNPKYARDLRALSRENQEEGEDRAFFSTPRSGDALAEELGEEAVGSMTSGEDQGERMNDVEVEEERGGPFVKTRAGDEFARGTDRSNPRSSTREPFPRT